MLLEDGTVYTNCFIALEWNNKYFYIKDYFKGIIEFIQKYKICFIRNNDMNNFDCIPTNKTYAAESIIQMMINKSC